jgi:hypothetical protein
MVVANKGVAPVQVVVVTGILCANGVTESGVWAVAST